MSRRGHSDPPGPGSLQPEDPAAEQSMTASAPETRARPAGRAVSVLLGLSAVELGVYTRMVARPSMTDTEVADAVAEMGASPGEGPAALDRLRRLGLVTGYPDDPTRHVATPPTTALDAMVAARGRSLARVRQQIRQLATRYHHRSDDGDALVEVVRGAAAIARLLNDVNQSACHEFVAFDAPPYFGDPLVGDIWPGDPPRLDLSFRVVFDPKSFEHPGRRTDLVDEVRTPDQQIRVAATPMKMALVDGRIGVMPLDQHTQPIEAFLLVREPGLVAALYALFEACWARAVPLHLHAGGTERHGAPRLPDRDRELLFLLVAGLTDRAIAAQLGWTDRTVRRRTSDMMRLLGADTRFQAGYQAVVRGWVTLQENDHRSTDARRP